MAAFLFVTASVALLAGLVSLVAGSLPRRRDARRARALPLPARQQDSISSGNASAPAHNGTVPYKPCVKTLTLSRRRAVTSRVDGRGALHHGPGVDRGSAMRGVADDVTHGRKKHQLRHSRALSTPW